MISPLHICLVRGVLGRGGEATESERGWEVEEAARRIISTVTLSKHHCIVRGQRGRRRKEEVRIFPLKKEKKKAESLGRA